MLRLASDADFDGKILRGLFQRQPDLDLVPVKKVGLLAADDPTILAWAASEDRILFSHDRATMTGFAYDRVRAGLPMPGLFIAGRKTRRRLIIDDILMIALCSAPDEWKDRVEFLPL
jgi:hypothetical protein